MVLTYPLPPTRLEMRPHPLSVHQLHDQDAARGEGALHRFQHREVVFRPVEIAERIAEDADAMEFAVAEPKTAGLAFMKGDLQNAPPGALARKSDHIARAAETGDMR